MHLPVTVCTQLFFFVNSCNVHKQFYFQLNYDILPPEASLPSWHVWVNIIGYDTVCGSVYEASLLENNTFPSQHSWRLVGQVKAYNITAEVFLNHRKRAP